LPTPIGHSLFGYLFYWSWKRKPIRRSFLAIIFISFISVLPDFDFLPGFLIGQPNRFHHGASHSFAAAFLLFAVLYAVEKWVMKARVPQLAPLVFFLYSLHLIADFFAADTSYPFGEQLFWPFSGRYVISPVTVFLDIRRESSLGQFIPSLFSLHNLKAVIIELVVAGILWSSIWFFKKKN
jgi:membrane-bound metal-dependent hydrolase YbcI (DUF457 family)